jgi:DNA (cytosine-5)-methyltransferase 1
MNELALFAGAGGGILGGKLLGWRTVCAVEWEPYPASVLCARQNDGLLPPFPVWDDVQTFDGRPWAGIVDVVSGGFPCQDISAAGKGAGIDGERSGMWGEMARIIHEVQPRYVFVENSPMLTSRGLGRVLGDLASMGFDARWGVLGAADIGANHQRNRIWIVATNTRHSKSGQQKSDLQQECFKSIWKKFSNVCENLADTDSAQRQRNQCIERTQQKHTNFNSASKLANATELFSNGGNFDRSRPKVSQLGNGDGAYGSSNHWWKAEPDVGRVADGVAARVDRLKAIGNGQVPLCAATAWRLLNGN